MGVILAEFGELSIEACYATKDYVPKVDAEDGFQRIMIWGLSNLLSFDGLLPARNIEKYRFAGETGSAIPVCLNVWPVPLGFWLNEYLHLGIALPAPYNFSSAPEVDCKKGNVTLSNNKQVIGHWKVWHDDWSPLQPSEGHTRCGSITEMKLESLQAASSSMGMTLSWYVELKLWERPKEYGELTLTKRSVFFRD